MLITYSVTLDLADDGALLDLTADVRALAWRLGAEDRAQAVALPGRARITVYDPGGRYSGASPVLGRWLTIRSHDGAAERLHFSGLVEALAPAAGPDAGGQAVLFAVTADAGLAALPARLPPITGAGPGALIAALLDDLPLRRPALSAVWVLGAPGFSETDQTARLAESLALAVQADDGIARFNYAALGGLPADQALRQIVVSAGGRCAVDRAGALVFTDRHRPLRAAQVTAELDDTMAALELAGGGDWANRVRVRFVPAGVGDPESVLWSLERAQRIPPGIRQMTVRFRAANGEPCAAWSVDRLAASATTGPDGTGEAAAITGLIRAADARSALLEFRNFGAADVWLTTQTRLYGTPLVFGAPLAAEQHDLLSIAFHGPRALELDLPLVDTLDEADGRARFELLCGSSPAMHAAWVELDARAVPSALSLTPGDGLRVRDSATGHDARYTVIGEAHAVDEGGARHRVRLFLEPLPVARFWELGLTALDSETMLAY